MELPFEHLYQGFSSFELDKRPEIDSFLKEFSENSCLDHSCCFREFGFRPLTETLRNKILEWTKKLDTVKNDWKEYEKIHFTNHFNFLSAWKDRLAQIYTTLNLSDELETDLILTMDILLYNYANFINFQYVSEYYAHIRNVKTLCASTYFQDRIGTTSRLFCESELLKNGDIQLCFMQLMDILIDKHERMGHLDQMTEEDLSVLVDIESFISPEWCYNTTHGNDWIFDDVMDEESLQFSFDWNKNAFFPTIQSYEDMEVDDAFMFTGSLIKPEKFPETINNYQNVIKSEIDPFGRFEPICGDNEYKKHAVANVSSCENLKRKFVESDEETHMGVLGNTKRQKKHETCDIV